MVQLDLNLDGILKVSARERATGLQKQITIENALARFEREERDAARERLERLWACPRTERTARDDDRGRTGGRTIWPADEDEMPSLVPGPREGQREAVQARALLEKAERLLEKVSAEDRGEVERLMDEGAHGPDRSPVGATDRGQQRVGRHAVLSGGRLMRMRCPVCKADNTQGPLCRRCKADLSLLFALEEQRRQALTAARRAAAAGDWPTFRQQVERADSLRRDDETKRLLTLAHFCTAILAACCERPESFHDRTRSHRGASRLQGTGRGAGRCGLPGPSSFSSWLPSSCGSAAHGSGRTGSAR